MIEMDAMSSAKKAKKEETKREVKEKASQTKHEEPKPAYQPFLSGSSPLLNRGKRIAHVKKSTPNENQEKPIKSCLKRSSPDSTTNSSERKIVKFDGLPTPPSNDPIHNESDNNAWRFIEKFINWNTSLLMDPKYRYKQFFVNSMPLPMPLKFSDVHSHEKYVQTSLILSRVRCVEFDLCDI